MTTNTIGTVRGHCGRKNITGGFDMLEGLAADTRVITYLMAAVGVLGIIAKIVNHVTLHRLVKAAGNMPKSTHRLIKLVRAKYEHACMIRDSVENIDAFVEKYIYEYRGFLFRIHTWRQIEILSVWFAGILAALGASVLYFYSGFSESVYQYIAAGIAEVILLSVVMRLSDEPYKINAVRMYMTDYLENICTFRLRRQNTREREFIDVISAEGSGKGIQASEENTENKRPEYAKQELCDPRRIVTAVVPCNSALQPYIPVRTDRELPKHLIDRLLNILYRCRVEIPVRRGDILIENFENSNVNVIFSSTITR